MVILSDTIEKQTVKIKKEKPKENEQIWISDTSFEYPTEKKDLEELTISHKNVSEYYKLLMEYALSLPDKVKKGQVLSPSPVLSILHKVIQEGLIDELYKYSTERINDEGFQSQSIAVTFGALKIGQGLGYDIEKLLKLGVAGFFENVGMYLIPDNILNKQGKLTKEEMEIIKHHPYHSAKIIRKMGVGYKWMEDIASQVHERWDGSGYPRGLKGEEILEPASIIGIMDVYIAMIKKKPYRDKFLQTEAIKSIIDIEKTKFPPHITKEFLKQITIFPINTYVKLNNHAIGKVVSTDRNNPMRPTIELLYDGVGKRVEGKKIINLTQTPMLHIIGTLDEKEVFQHIKQR